MLRLLVLLLLLVPQLGWAEPRCPDSFSPSNPKRTVTDDFYPIPLDKKITVLYEGNYYQIPAGYFTGWPFLKTNKPNPFGYVPKGINPDEVQKYSRLNFNFWMPSLRYPERDLSRGGGLRPCEDGRPYVAEDSKEYMVAVQTRERDALKPSQKFKNVIAADGGGMEGHVFTKKYGLLEYYSKKYPPKNEEVRKRYTNIPKTTPEVQLRCPFSETRVCSGDYLYPDKKPQLWIMFQKQDLPYWRKNVDAAFTLLERWKVKDKKTLEQIKNMKISED